MKQSANIADMVIIFESGGYINIAEGVSFANKEVEIPAAFEAMFYLDDVKKGIREFTERIYQGMPIPKLIEGKSFAAAPEGYSMAIVNAYGRALGMVVPNIVLSISIASGKEIKCACTNGSCTPDSAGMGAIKYCKGNCSGTCTLSTAIIEANGEFKTTYTARAYRY